MRQKNFFKDTNVGFVLQSLLWAVLVAVVLLVVLLVWLRHYTEHGVEEEVPAVTGLYIEEALPLLEARGLRAEVVDSTYSSKVPLGTIVEQTPPAASHVKHGRVIYLIVNAKSRRMVPLPDLTDMSYRQAQAMLRQLGLGVEDIEYEPSEYKDLVLDVRRRGESLAAGTRLEEGSSVTLVVGYGKGTEQVAVPDLRGKSLIEARALLLGCYLTVGMADYDEEVTDDNREQFAVYRQSPAAGTMLLQGSHVDISLSTDLEKAVTTDNTEEDDTFF
ncbi:MAG: PASTA domain-containing protein [Paludibacteraceae bacterium]|nr:PASTA domain-containing protein [Paludibacteraceae bacterium]